jgi:hypothetical protein
MLCVGFFFFFMPEMKGRSLEELDEIFVAGTPVRKFSEYQCVIREEAVHDVNVSKREEDKTAGYVKRME